MRRLRANALLIALAGGLILVTAACTSTSTAPTPSESPAVSASPATSDSSSATPLITVEALPKTFTTLDGGTLHLRSAKSGAVTATLATHVTVAVPDPKGVVVARVSGCRTVLSQVSTKGVSTALRTVKTPITRLAISPDQKTIAYLSPSNCTSTAPATVLTLLNVKTGTASRVDSPSATPFTGVAWGPNPTLFAVAFGGTTPSMEFLHASAPALAGGYKLAPPNQCNLTDPAWGNLGLYAVVNCVNYQAGKKVLPLHVALIDDGVDGAVSTIGTWDSTWNTPKCAASVQLAVSAIYVPVYYSATIGYGTGACASPKQTVVGSLSQYTMDPLKSPKGAISSSLGLVG